MNQPHAPDARPPGVDERVEIDLSAILSALRRSLRWIVPLVAAVVILTFLILQFVPARYRAESKVLIETSNIVYPGDVRGAEEERALLDTEGVASQVELLQSRDLMRRVAQRLDLASVAEFEAGSSSLVRDMFVALGLMRDTGSNTREERVLKVFYDNLEVFRVDGSRVISVRYVSRDPELAARIANAVVEEYLDLQSSVKRETTDIAAASLEPQIERLREEVQAAQKRVEEFRSQNDLLLGADNQTLDRQQLGEIGTQLSDARAAQSQAEARAKLIRSQLAGGGSLDGMQDVLNSQLIQRLRERQVELQARIAELSTTLLPNHPQIRALRSQLDDFERQIRQEAGRVAAGLENEAGIQQERVASLQATLEQLKTRAAQSNDDQVRLRDLEREAAVKTTQLDQLMTRYREADTRRNATAIGADARVISRATVPVEPFSPKVPQTVAIAAFVALMLSAIAVILGVFVSGRAFVTRVIEPGEGTGSPYAGADTQAAARTGAVPAYGAGASTFSYGWSAPASVQPAAAASAEGDVDEAPQEAVGAPAVSGLDGPVAPVSSARPRRVAVLSVDSDEISQSVTFRLVRTAAEEGVMPLFLEVRPDLADPEAVPGFAELLDGTASFAGVIYRDAASRAHVIEAGRRAIDDELAQNERFEMLMEAIDHTYDQVFFDLGLIDDSLISAQILAMADQVVVASGGAPADPEMEDAMRMLEDQTGAPVIVETVSDGTRARAGRTDMAA
ncbi:exopolysaccharide transport family protein [Stappia sp. WLB 29]|uniref:exopolysaccharide transport family protein n=1 Tax=Stappia sp. WLB 29 TaxID=2925220 RepID=UPI0020BDF52D|nr:exopolysaccharide transport family protein [Stappia sp. WLB 29]